MFTPNTYIIYRVVNSLILVVIVKRLKLSVALYIISR